MTDGADVFLAEYASADWTSLEAAVALGVLPQAVRNNTVDVGSVKVYAAGADEIVAVHDHMQVLAVAQAAAIAKASNAGAGAGALVSFARAWINSVHHNGASKCLLPLCELLFLAGIVRDVKGW